MKIFTIGFTKKTAEQFFTLLLDNEIQHLLDIRLNPSGQLAGFAKQEDLPYFLKHLSKGCEYIYMPLLAPTKEILTDYRENKDWSLYVTRFEALMDERRILSILDPEDFEKYNSCLLCSEATPEQCHRRLVVERLKTNWLDVEIIHI